MSEANKNISLIGYRGTGKSTVGRMLAERLRLPFVDVDDQIEQRAECSIAEIFAEWGEPAFRDLETAVIADIARAAGCVVSLGGGAVLRPENRQRIQQFGPVVWLRASVDTIVRRLEADQHTRTRRPDLTPTGGRMEIEKLLRQRQPLYEACATMAVDTDERDVGEVVEWITRRVE